MKIIIKVVMVAMLIGCLLNVPYGYFQFIRIACCIGFIYLAYEEFKVDKIVTGLFCVAGAILLNPVYKIHFVRKVWNGVDIALAALIIVWIVYGIIKSNGKINGREEN